MDIFLKIFICFRKDLLNFSYFSIYIIMLCAPFSILQHFHIHHICIRIMLDEQPSEFDQIDKTNSFEAIFSISSKRYNDFAEDERKTIAQGL